MKRSILAAVLLAACATDGEDGAVGPEGPAGPMGTPADRLVWLDPAGQPVANAFVGMQPTSFVMKVVDGAGLFYSINPLNGVAQYDTYNSAQLTRFYLGPGCVGPAYVSIGTPPNVPFKWDGRAVAMPIDVEVALTVGSYVSGSCTNFNGVGTFIRTTVLNELPTVTPPVLGAGPFHVARM